MSLREDDASRGDEAIEQLLAEVIAGERPVDDPEVQALLARRPDLRPKLDELRELGAMLDSFGLEQREDLSAARGRAVTGEERAVAAAREEMGAWRRATQAEKPKGTIHRWIWPALAVAAALIVGFATNWGATNQREGGTKSPEPYFLSQPFEGASPSAGTVWPDSRPLEIDMGLAEVRGQLVFELHDGATGASLWTSPRLRRSTYRLTLDEWQAVLAGLTGDLITLRVQLNGRLIHVATFSLER